MGSDGWMVGLGLEVGGAIGYVLSRHTVAREIRLSGRYLETMSLKVSDHVLRRARFWFYHASRVGLTLKKVIYIYT